MLAGTSCLGNKGQWCQGMHRLQCQLSKQFTCEGLRRCLICTCHAMPLLWWLLWKFLAWYVCRKACCRTVKGLFNSTGMYKCYMLQHLHCISGLQLTREGLGPPVLSSQEEGFTIKEHPPCIYVCYDCSELWSLVVDVWSSCLAALVAFTSSVASVSSS